MASVSGRKGLTHKRITASGWGWEFREDEWRGMKAGSSRKFDVAGIGYLVGLDIANCDANKIFERGLPRKQASRDNGRPSFVVNNPSPPNE